MPFRYRLEVLLRLQRSLEKQAENRLLGCVARIAALKRKSESLNESRLQKRRQTVEDFRDGGFAAELNMLVDWEVQFKGLQAQIVVELAAAEKERQVQVEKVCEERQKREVLESLKEKQLSTYTLEESRHVQQILDDLHLMRIGYRKS